MTKPIPYGHTQISPTWHVLRIPRTAGDVAFFGRSKSEVEQKEYNYWRSRDQEQRKGRRETIALQILEQDKTRILEHQAAIQVVAKKYRWEMPRLADRGVVVINQYHEPAGWMNELRDPHEWEPGCAAVDIDAAIWLAAGGNAQDGAERWEPVHPAHEQEACQAQAPRATASTPDLDALSHLPPQLREFAAEENTVALHSSANQRGLRHVL